MISDIGSAISGARDAVSEIKDVGSSIVSGDDDGSRLGVIGDIGSSVVSGAKDVLTGQKSLGGAVGGALDSLGLPDWASDFAGAALDVATKNFAGAAEQATSGLGEVADAAGIDRAADFLDTASDVTGMFHDIKGGGALASSSSSVMGVAEEVGSLSNGIGQADELARQGSAAIEAVDAFREGDLEGGASGVFDVLDSSLGVVDGVLEGRVDPDGSLSEALADSGGVTERVVDVVRDGIVTDTGGTSQQLGSRLEAAMGPLSENLVETARNAGSLDGVEQLTPREAVDESVEIACGMMDVASASPEVADELVSTLDQIGATSSSADVREMLGAQVRG